MHPLVNIGVAAARRAGSLILRSMDKIDTLNIQEKGINDFVTQVDKACEEEIIYIIKKAYPDHAILGEESGLTKSKKLSPITWIIDPLDGTTNFIHGFPQYCVSIGIMENNRMEHGIILDPIKDEIFTASRGQGAQLNNRRIRVSNVETLGGALLGTGFPTRSVESLEQYLKLFRELFPASSGMRRAGAAALDLAYVASGRLDGFFESGLKIWDVAAGSLMIKEAGGLITSYKGDESYFESGNVVCGNPKVYQAMLALIQKHIK